MMAMKLMKGARKAALCFGLLLAGADAESFIDELRKAKRLKIEADFFQEGPRVFEFDVRGLNW